MNQERIDAWLASAVADAERRGLPGLKPLLEGLAQSLAALRAADQDQAQERDSSPATNDDNGRS